MNIKLILILLFSIASLVIGKDIQVDQLAQIAQNYKIYKKSNFPQWSESKITCMTPFYSSNGTLLAYEAEVISKESKEKGYIFVNVLEEGAVIPSFSTEGKSISKILLEYLRKEIQLKAKKAKIHIVDNIFLIAYPASYAIGIKFDKSAPFLKDISCQNGWYIFTPFFQSSNVDYMYRKLKSKKVFDREREAYKQELLRGNFNSKFFTAKQDKSSKTKSYKKSNYIHGTFRQYYQEKLRWSDIKDKVYAGCTPIAWAIALEYLDRHGFPWLTGTNVDNQNIYTNDPDVRYMIKQLRYHLKTIGGNTYTKNLANGKYYAQQRGYKNFNSRNYQNQKWSIIKSSINANQPIITSYNMNRDIGHSAVCYKYIDEYSRNDDKFCIRTGWKKPLIQCIDRRYLSVVTTIQTNKEHHKRDYYGAYVISKRSRGYSISWNHKNRKNAEVDALKKCRKKFKGCYIVKTIKNECLAIANEIGRAHGYFLAGKNINNIKSKVVKKCNNMYHNNCEIKVFCSMGD